jgi:hypothetical protein
VDRLLAWNLKLIAFTLPFQIAGVEAGGYPFSLTVLPLREISIFFDARPLRVLAPKNFKFHNLVLQRR